MALTLIGRLYWTAAFLGVACGIFILFWNKPSHAFFEPFVIELDHTRIIKEVNETCTSYDDTKYKLSDGTVIDLLPDDKDDDDDKKSEKKDKDRKSERESSQLNSDRNDYKRDSDSNNPSKGPANRD